MADQRAQSTAQMILRHAQTGLNKSSRSVEMARLGGHMLILDLIQSLRIVAPLLFAPIRFEEDFERSLAVKSSQKLSGRQRAIVF